MCGLTLASWTCWQGTLVRSKREFAVFILTHGRPNRVYTYATLEKCGYTGPVYFVVDNEDLTVDEYRKNFGANRVIVFDKLAISKRYDTADTEKDRRAIFYARNACFDIAKDLGYEHFIELDDDYTTFDYRYVEGTHLRARRCKSLDEAFEAMVDFLEDSKAAAVAFAQAGDLIGAPENDMIQAGYKRKCMNSWVLRTDSPLRFVGRINEDVNTYVVNGIRGDLFLTVPHIALVQKETQSNAGGMTELYKENGTYLKSMYTVMMAPSCVKVAMMGPAKPRLHHRISTHYAYPKVLSERYYKGTLET